MFTKWHSLLGPAIESFVALSKQVLDEQRVRKSPAQTEVLSLKNGETCNRPRAPRHRPTYLPRREQMAYHSICQEEVKTNACLSEAFFLRLQVLPSTPTLVFGVSLG